ncbi:MAG: TIGR04086 family membrane protein, partial [Actinomycetota bacterium]
MALRPIMPRLDPASVLRGAAVTLVITVPPAVAVRLMDDDGDMAASNWARLAFLVILIGFGAGGWVAARRQPSAPLAHGAVAAFVGYAVVQGVGIVRRLATGEPLEWLSFVFAALLAASTGAVGGLIADR